MRRFLPLLSLSLIPALATPTLAATEPSRITPLENNNSARALVEQLKREGKIISSSDVKRGMRGYALSVFQGTKIEKFNIEVLGTLERVRGGSDLVMIRVLDGPVVTRQSGIIQGMSGSPVYINGKLLGAIAIGFGFPKEPIGGVTPITQMIQTGLPDNSPKSMPLKVARAVYTPKTPIRVANRQISRVLVAADPKRAPFSGTPEATTMTMRPCTNYLLLSGVGVSSLDRWKRTLEPYGVTPILGGGAMSSGMQRQVFGIPSRKTGVQANLAPGAAIGVQLASGDVDATSVGTVTYRVGNRVLAFGHPLYNLGAVSMPMTTAYVHDIFPAYDTSFKMASPIKAVGELQQDANFAVGGTVGRRAQTIPLRISITDPAKKIDRHLNIRLIKDPLFTPELLTNIVSEAVQSTIGLDSNKTVKTSLNIKLSNAPTIRRFNTAYAADAVLPTSLAEMLDALSITQQNPYEKGSLAGIDLGIQVLQGRHTARIRRVFADRNRVKAGETVQVSVELEPTGKPNEIVTRRFSVPVPIDSPRGLLRIAVSPADSYWAARGRVGGAPPRPSNLKELVNAYGQIGASNELLLQASTPRRFLLVDQKKVPNPPSLWSRIVPAAPSTSLGTFNETIEKREASEFVLSGLESISLPVESVRASDRERPDAASSSDSSSSSSDTTVAVSPDDDDETQTELAVSTPVERARSFLAGSFQTPYNSLRPFAPLFKTSLETAVGGAPVARAVVVAPATTPAPSATPVTTPTPTPSPSPTPDAGANSIARPVGRWIQRSATEFRRGQFYGSVVRDDGTILPGPASRLLESTSEPVAWSVAVAPSGAIYLGTGHSARLIKIQNGNTTVVYEGPEVAVSALALDGDGNVYAGVSPGGRVYRFTPDGRHTTVLQTNETFVHGIAIKGNQLYAVTGGERGGLYRVNIGAEAASAGVRVAPLATVPQRHLRSLALEGSDVFVGSSDEAVLYRVSSQGEVTALYQAAGAIQSTAPTPPSSAPTTQVVVVSPGGNPNTTSLLADNGTLPGGGGSSGNEILAVAAAPDGDGVYFGTLTSGTVYRWSKARGVQEAWKSTGRSIYSLYTNSGDVYAGCDGGEVWRLTPINSEIRAARVLDAPQPQVLALTMANGRTYAATANNAAVYEIGASSNEATYFSNVFDAGQIVRFGALRFLGENISLETRSGNVLDPDSTWSAFAPLQSGLVVSPPARYLQYRVKVEPNGSLSRVEVLFRAPNRAPRVAWTLPVGGEFLSGKKTLTWSVADPDGDSTRSTVEISGTDGFKAVEMKNPTQNNAELDTKKFADGSYTARVTVSDAARNPDDPQSDMAMTLPFTIDNTAPTLSNLKAVKALQGWTLTANGSDLTSPLAGAEWRVAPATPVAKTGTTSATSTSAKTDDDTTKTAAPETGPSLWQAVAASDGLFDSKSESLVATLDSAFATVPLKSGLKIEVRLRDAAGNLTTSSIDLP